MRNARDRNIIKEARISGACPVYQITIAIIEDSRNHGELLLIEVLGNTSSHSNAK